MKVSAGALAAGRRLAAEHLGLHLPADRDADLAGALGGAAASWGFASVEEGLHHIDGAGDGDVRWGPLVARLTVGETYFWRDAALMAELEERLLPSLIRAARVSGRLRLRVMERRVLHRRGGLHAGHDDRRAPAPARRLGRGREGHRPQRGLRGNGAARHLRRLVDARGAGGGPRPLL